MKRKQKKPKKCPMLSICVCLKTKAVTSGEKNKAKRLNKAIKGGKK